MHRRHGLHPRRPRSLRRRTPPGELRSGLPTLLPNPTRSTTGTCITRRPPHRRRGSSGTPRIVRYRRHGQRPRRPRSLRCRTPPGELRSGLPTLLPNPTRSITGTCITRRPPHRRRGSSGTPQMMRYYRRTRLPRDQRTRLPRDQRTRLRNQCSHRRSNQHR